MLLLSQPSRLPSPVCSPNDPCRRLSASGRKRKRALAPLTVPAAARRPRTQPGCQVSLNAIHGSEAPRSWAIAKFIHHLSPGLISRGKAGSGGGPRVRIPLPPARSLLRTRPPHLRRLVAFTREQAVKAPQLAGGEGRHYVGGKQAQRAHALLARQSPPGERTDHVVAATLR
jgi:hypothetical protein